MATGDDRRVAITGVGLSVPGRGTVRPIMEVMLDAIDEALADAGLSLQQIDGMATFPSSYNLGAGAKYDSPVDVIELREVLGIDVKHLSGGVEGPAQFASIFDAIGAIMSGQATHVLCYRTLAQYTQQRLARAKPRKEGTDYERVSGKWIYHRPFNVLSPVAPTAMMFRRHCHEFGTTKEQLGALVVNTRANAALNPKAVYREPLTLEDYLEARMICDPLGLYDCDALLDAATVVIVSRLDAARDLRKAPLVVESFSGRMGGRYSWDQFEPKWGMMALENGPQLWRGTDCAPADVKVANLYDGFSPQVLIWLEALGFCGKGESGPFVEGGTRIALDGELPLNTGGGQLSGGRMHGFGLLWETCIQMWGEGGARQVPGNVDVGVAAAGGGPLAGSILLRRD